MTEETRVRIASHADKLGHRDVSCIHFCREYKANPLCEFMGLERRNVFSVELYTAFQRRKKTRERAQQRGFPDTVRAYQARELARMQGCLQVGSHRFALISDG